MRDCQFSLRFTDSISTMHNHLSQASSQDIKETVNVAHRNIHDFNFSNLHLF